MLKSYELLNAIEHLTTKNNMTPGRDFEFDQNLNGFRFHQKVDISPKDYDYEKNQLKYFKIISIDNANDYEPKAYFNDILPIFMGSPHLFNQNQKQKETGWIEINSFADIMPTNYIFGKVNLSQFQSEDRLLNIPTKMIDYRLEKNRDHSMRSYKFRSTVDLALNIRGVILTDIVDEFPLIHGNISMNILMDIKKLKEKVVEIITPKMTEMSSISLFDATNRQIFFDESIFKHNDMVRGKLSMEEFEEKKKEIRNL